MAGLASLAELEVWRRELAPTPGRWRNALRLTVACTAAAGLAQAFHLEQGFWAIITILVLAPPTVAASLRKAAARVLGTAVGCLAAVGAAALFAQLPPLYLAAIVLYLAATLYFALGPVSPYSFFVAGFTFALVTYTAVQEPERAGVMAAHRFTEISLGVLISAASHLLLWPTHADRELRRTLAEKLARAIAWLDSACTRARGGSPEAPAADPAPDDRLTTQMTLLDVAAGLHEPIRRTRDAWTGVIGLTEALRLACAECGRLASLPASAAGLTAVRAEMEQLVLECTRFGDALAGSIRSQVRAPEVRIEALAAVEAAFDRLRAEGATRAWAADSVTAFAAVIESQRIVVRTLERLAPMIDAALGLADQREHLELPAGSVPTLLPLDPDRLAAAIKSSLAASIAIVIGSALHWPLGLPSTATCLVLAMTTSVGSFVQKAGSRLIGAFIGSAGVLLILLWLMPSINSIVALLLITAIGMLPCAWLVAGSDRVSYLGLQTAYAFSIALLGPLSPVVDLVTPTSRILGVFLGIVVFGAMTTLVWPSYATKQYRRAIRSALRITVEILRDAVSRRSSAPFVVFPRQRRLYDSIGACTRLLGESEYEDPNERHLHRGHALALLWTVRHLARSAILWRQSRWSAASEIPPCDTTAALASLGEHCMARIEALADSIGERRPPPPEFDTAAALHALEAAIARDRAALAFRTWPAEAVDALFACVEYGRDIAVNLGVLREQAILLAAPDAPPLAYAAAAA